LQITALLQEAASDFSQERWAAAIEKLEVILSLEPTHVEVEAKLGEARQHQELAQLCDQGVKHYEGGHLNKALDDLRRVESTKRGYKDAEKLIAAIQDKLEKKKIEELEQVRAASASKQPTDRIPLFFLHAKPVHKRLTSKSWLITGGLVALVGLVIAAVFYGRRTPPVPTSPFVQSLGEIRPSQIIRGVAISPDGQVVASAGEGGDVSLWQVSNCNLIKILNGEASSGGGVTVSPNGQIVASGRNDGKIYLWSVTDARLIKTLRADKSIVFAVRFSSNGQTLISASFSGGSSNDGIIQMWQVSDWTLLKPRIQSFQETILTFDPDKQIAALQDQNKQVRVRSLNDGKLAIKLKDYSYDSESGAFSNDGQFLALGDMKGTVRIWRVSNGELVNTLPADGDEVVSIIFSPNGQRIAAGHRNGTIQIWRVIGAGQGISLKGHTKRIGNMAFSENGKVMASCSDDNTIRLWQIGDNQQ